MNRRLLFRNYAEQRSECVPTGYRRDEIAGMTRLTPVVPDLGGMVMFSRLPEDRIDDSISEQIAHFRELDLGFEWKVHDFDTPANLRRRLEAFGFTKDVTEAFMLYSIQAGAPRAVPKGDFLVERIFSEEGIRQIVANQERIWNGSFPWLEPYFKKALSHLALFCAYADGDPNVPVGAGWIEFLEGSDFAELHGGSVLPHYRGRGVYSALFRAREEEAKRRGVRYLAVDAAPMSRPILLKKGFEFICETTPYRKKRRRPVS